MNHKTVAALFALVALPVAAQNAAPRSEARPPSVQAQGKAATEAGAAKKERTRLAKPDCEAKSRKDRPKKAKAAS